MFYKILFDHIVLTSLYTYQIIAIERMCTFSYVCLIKHKLTSFCFYGVHKLPTVPMWDSEDKEAFFLFLKFFSFFFLLIRNHSLSYSGYKHWNYKWILPLLTIMGVVWSPGFRHGWLGRDDASTVTWVDVWKRISSAVLDTLSLRCQWDISVNACRASGKYQCEHQEV